MIGKFGQPGIVIEVDFNTLIEEFALSHDIPEDERGVIELFAYDIIRGQKAAFEFPQDRATKLLMSFKTVEGGACSPFTTKDEPDGCFPDFEVLEVVKLEDVDHLTQEILQAKTSHLYAMGRMQLSVRAFAMRLKHMGIDTYVVYDTTSPRIGPGDLLIDHCAVTNVELNVVRLAKAAGAQWSC